ncbi:hypothetical protein FRC03_009192 [Tulasnella sp. 419]|nr:hypothetical protein FRC03_009192 [Tulasnella sp. 419]
MQHGSSSHYTPSSNYFPSYPFKRLPKELLLYSLELNWEQGSEDIIRDFASFSLVSSEWRPIAQRILFSKVTITTIQRAQRLIAALTSNQSLARATIILHFSGKYYFSAHPDEVFHSYRVITDLCPNLYRLDINIWDRTSSELLPSGLGPRTYTNLKALSLTMTPAVIHEYHDAPSVKMTSEDLLDFLGRFSSLKHLQLLGTMDIDPPVTRTVPSYPSLHLYEFAYRGRKTTNQLIEKLLDRIVGNDQSLEILTIHVKDRLTSQLAYQWAPLLKRCGKNIRSLELKAMDDFLKPENSLKNLCPNLQELIIPELDLTSKLMENIPAENLEHISFRSLAPRPNILNLEKKYPGAEISSKERERTKEMPSNIANWLASLPNLRQVTICPTDEDFPRSRELVEVCINHDINVICHKSFHKFQQVRTDMIPVSHFPRNGSVSTYIKTAMRLARSIVDELPVGG